MYVKFLICKERRGVKGLLLLCLIHCCSFFPHDMIKYTKKLSGTGIEPQYDPSTYKTD